MKKSLELSSTYARIVLQTAEIESGLLLEGSGLTLTSVSQSTFIDWRQIARLFRNYASLQRSPAWTADVGTRLNTVSHGPLGFAALTAPTLGEAIKVMATYAEVRQSVMRSELRHENGRYYLILEDQTGDADFARWTSEIIVKVIELLLEAILGHAVGQNVLINFAYPPPEHSDKLIAAYGSTVVFNAMQTSISIPEVWRLLPSPLYDEAVFRANISKCDEIIAGRHPSVGMKDRVLEKLSETLDQNMMQHNKSLQPPSLTALASAMHLTPRTLIRHLKSEGTAYSAILEELRRETATRLLRDASLSIAEVSELLGYREAASFVRSFKKWCGKPPAAWRRQSG